MDNRKARGKIRANVLLAVIYLDIIEYKFHLREDGNCEELRNILSLIKHYAEEIEEV